ncbi:MAG: hypothetical protein WBA74_09575, partial [Cyclobacteriaceae bacterium]
GNGFIGGGRNIFGIIRDVKKYDPDKDEWGNSFQLKDEFANGFGMVIDNFAYVGFGESDDQLTKIMKGEWKHWN